MITRCHKIRTILFLLSLFTLVEPARAQLIYPGSVDTTGPEEIVFNWQTDSCEQIDIPDAPARFFRDADGKIQLIAPHYTNYRMIGDDFNSLVRDCANGPIMSSHKNHDPAKWDDHEWIVSTYTTDGKTIHAIIHNEFHGAENTDFVSCPSGDYLKCWYNGLTYASSSDTGRTFTHAAGPGHFVATIPYQYEPDIGPSGIFGGSNIIYNKNDGYYYVLIHLEARGLYSSGTGIMRTQDLSDPTSWRAWDGGGYNVQFIDPHNNSGFDPANHVAVPIAANGALEKMHASLTWNTYFNKWMIVGSAQKGGVWGIYYSVSEDLIHWTVRKKIMSANLLINPAHATNQDVIAYPTIVDHADTSRNFEITGQDVYLYFTRWHITSGTYDRDLVRVPIRFNKLEVNGFEVTGGGNQEDVNPGDGICKTAAGLCGLKAALEESNARPPWYADSLIHITFNMNFSTLKTINVNAGIQSIWYPVHIDGFTQPGASANTAPFGDPINANYMVELHFAGENGVNGLSFEANGNTIRGLILNGQQGPALQFNNSDSNIVEGVWVNVDDDGTTLVSNANDGITLTSSSYNVIGDTTAAGRNLILGGIRIKGPDAHDNRVEGNYIGTDYTGMNKLDQWGAGVGMQDAAQNNIIGGTNIKARNLISGNNSNGVAINDAGSSGNQILNNWIGVNAQGTGTVEQSTGIVINRGAEGNYIGKPGAGNIIVGAAAEGIAIDNAPRNFIQGNFIGTDSTGTQDWGNGGAAIYFLNNSEEFQIGGAGAGEGNTIAFNGAGGIGLQGNSGTRIKIWSNNIYKNANGLGIDLGFDNWPNENDNLDADTGVNNLQNAPVLISAINGEVQINGTLHSTPNTTFRIEFFASDTCDPSGYGEGQRYLDAMAVTTDANGDATINTTLTKTVDAGAYITATASDPNWNTSEFSNCVVANPAEGILSVSPSQIDKTLEINTGGTEVLTINNLGNLAVDWTLTKTASWLTLSTSTETIQPQTSNEVVLTFDATSISEGAHRDTLVISNSNGQQADITVPVELTVTATPDISISPDSLAAQVVSGFSITKTLTVTNAGNGTLNWSANAPIDKQIWTNVIDKNGSLAAGESATVNIELKSQTLSTGVHSTEVEFNSNDPDEWLIVIPVSFTVSGDGPVVSITPVSISETLVSGDSVVKKIVINSLGTQNVTWNASANTSWLLPSPASGTTAPGTTDTLEVTLKSQGLTVGSHTDTLEISSNDPNNATTRIPVSLTVEQAAPVISINSDNFSRTIALNDSLDIYLYIENTGTGNLDWNITSQASWLQVLPALGQGSGGSVDTVRIRISSVGKPIGVYADTLQLSSSDPNTPLWKITIRMDVTNNTPEIAVTQSNLVATLDPGETTTHSIAVMNNGSADLQWTMTWSSSWVIPSTVGSTVSPGGSDNFTVEVSTAGLAGGTYVDSLVISSNDPNNPTVFVEVWLTVTAHFPVMDVSQDNLGSKIPQGTTHTHTVVIANWGNANLEWTATKSAEWVKPSIMQGIVIAGLADTMDVELSAVGLSTGKYSDTLAISSNDPNNSLWKISISLNVQAGNGSMPNIEVKIDTIFAAIPQGQNHDYRFMVYNRGDGILNYSNGTAFFAKWLGISPRSGSLSPHDSLQVLVSMHSDTLSIGRHEGAVMVQSNDSDQSNIVIPVIVEITDGVTQNYLQPLPNSFAVEVNVGGTAVDDLQIKNDGPVPIGWELIKSATWLAVQPATGTLAANAIQPVSLQFNAANLSAGIYADTLELRPTDGSQPAVPVFVHFEVTGIAVLAALPETLDVAIDPGVQTTAEFAIGNAGSADLNWQVALLNTPDWVTISESGGSTQPGDSSLVALTFDGTSLQAGESFAFSLEITCNDPAKPTLHIAVVVKVNPGAGVFATSSMPQDFRLSQNFPNPFNPATAIHYALPEQAWVTLSIYDISGRQVYELVNQLQAAANYSVKWQGIGERGQPVAAGVYLYKIIATGASGRHFVQTRKMMFLK